MIQNSIVTESRLHELTDRQASHSDPNQWDSKASMKKDRRVRGAKYMARSVSDGRIRDP